MMEFKIIVILLSIFAITVILSPVKQQKRNGLIALCICAVLGTGILTNFSEIFGTKGSQVATTQTSNDKSEKKIIKDSSTTDKKKSNTDSQKANNNKNNNKTTNSSTSAQDDMKTDLSLGGLDLGDAEARVKQIVREAPSDMQQEGDLIRCYYTVMEVVLDKNKNVVGLVSNSDIVKTKRGIHQNSTFVDVKKAYGTDYQRFTLDGGITCYEYPFTSQNGKNGLLRFAVRDSDQKVDYISVRIV